MAKDKHDNTPGRGNPPKTGGVGKGPGNSKTRGSAGTRPFGTNYKNAPMHAGPSNKGGKPPRT